MAYKPKTLSVLEGGTGQVTLTNHGVLIGAGTTAITQLSEGATGTVLTGVSTLDPVFSATPAITSVTLSGGTSLTSYVEATYTPVLTFGNASVGITYTTQLGQYTKIGNIVFYTIIITLSSKGSSTGSARVSLPVNNGPSTSSAPSSRFSGLTLTVLFTQIGCSISGNLVQLQQMKSAGSAAALTDVQFANTSSFYLAGHYYTS